MIVYLLFQAVDEVKEVSSAPLPSKTGELSKIEALISRCHLYAPPKVPMKNDQMISERVLIPYIFPTKKREGSHFPHLGKRERGNS